MKTVCFFGEGAGAQTKQVRQQVERAVMAMIRSKRFVTIHVNDRNAFDRMVIDTVRRCQDETRCTNVVLVIHTPDCPEEVIESRMSLDCVLLEQQVRLWPEEARRSPALLAGDLLWSAETAVVYARQEKGWVREALENAEASGVEVIRIGVCF